MSSFVGNLLLTTIICSIVVLLALAISPLFKKYTKKWRYVIFLVVAVKLLLPMPMYTSEKAIIIPLVREATDEKNSENSNTSKIDYANKNSENKNGQQLLQANKENAKVDSVKNDNALDNNKTNDIKVNDAQNNDIANSAQQLDDNSTGNTENSVVVNADSKVDGVTALQSTENNDAKADEATRSTFTNKVSAFVADLNMEIVYIILFGVWCVGTVIFGLYYVFMYFYHRRSINRWSTNVTDEHILAMLEEEKERLNITKNLVLKKCKKINTPMTLGFRHLSIVLPYAEYNEDSTRYILRHELTHQKRNDIYAKVLFIAAKCLHWFNPVVPMMVNRAYDDMEILCDDMVVADMEKNQRIEYNETILNIAKMKSEDVTGKNILFAFCFVEKESNLKERVKNIMIMSKRKKGYQIVALAMALIVAGSCFISCGTNKKETTEITREDATEAATEEVTTSEAGVVSNEGIYEQYIKESLAPEYGLADTTNFYANITTTNYEVTGTDRGIQLDGMVSAYIDDMNGDGSEDLIVVRFMQNGEDESLGKKYELVIGAYTVKDGKVELLNEVYPSLTEADYSAYVAEKGIADVSVKLDTVTDGTNKYVMLEYSTVPPVGDAGFEYFVAYKLKENELVSAYSFEPNAASSAPMVDTYGYVDGQKELLYTSGYSEVETEAKYATYEEALIGFWSEYGITVQIGTGEGVVSSESIVDNIFSYKWSSLGEGYSDDSGNTIFEFEQQAQDYTNLPLIAGDVAEVATEDTNTEIEGLVSAKPSICEAMNVPEEYKDALEGNADIIVGDSKLNIIDYVNLDRNRVEPGVDLSKYEYHINGYTLIDLNNDGLEEVILELASWGTQYAILHYEDGNVYGYNHLYRNTYGALKKEGIFVSDLYSIEQVVKLEVDKGTLIETVLARHEEKYYVDGKKSNKKKFQEVYNENANKENAEFVGVVTPILAESMAENGVIYVCDQNEEWNGSYTFDFNMDGKAEKIDVKTEVIDADLEDYLYKISIDGKEELALEGHNVAIKITDIDSSDSEYEFIAYSQTNDDMYQYGIYRVTEDGLVNLNEEIDDNHIYVSTTGDGILKTEWDDYSPNAGCFYLEQNYQYIDGKLVDMTENDIYNYAEYSLEHELELYRDIKVYKDYDLKDEVTTLKKGSVIRINRIHTNGLTERGEYMIVYYDAAEILVDGKVVGWIEIPKEEYEWGKGLFTGETMPAWD